MILSYAILRDEPPQVFLADDMDTLHWVLALEVVAQTPPDHLGESVAVIRAALLDERWADAVVAWIDATDRPIDVYPATEVYAAHDVAMAAAELQFTRLFGGAAPSVDPPTAPRPDPMADGAAVDTRADSPT